MRVREVMDLVLSAMAVERLERTVDTLKSGSPDQAVTGIVTTFTATLDVLRQCVERRANMVIAHEPTYYGHEDRTDWLAGDAVFEAKRAFVERHGIAIWRLHDYWHVCRPDGILTGVVCQLGWEQWQDGQTPWLFRIPTIGVLTLARQLKAGLGAQAVRVVGPKGMRCARVALILGAAPMASQVEAVRHDDVDVVVVGEAREWETYEYVRDAAASGMRKALIVVGHCSSEEPGMEYLAGWLAERLPDMPVSFVPAGDSFRAV